MTSVRSSDALDFDTAWAEVLRQYEPAVRVASALLKLTGLGEHAVHIELLAEAINQPVPDTRRLDDALWAPQGHYSAAGNEVVGRELARLLQSAR